MHMKINDSARHIRSFAPRRFRSPNDGNSRKELWHKNNGKRSLPNLIMLKDDTGTPRIFLHTKDPKSPGSQQ